MQVTAEHSVTGGDICDSYRFTLSDGRQLFVKTRAQGPPEMFPAEARGLRWLEETQTLRVPQVIAANEHFLALEYLDSGLRMPGFDEALGAGLAQLHRYPTTGVGLDHCNFIGPLLQCNEPCRSWGEFYAERRLRPLWEKAINRGLAPEDWARKFHQLVERFPDLLPDETLSRLHGDLWGGNVHLGPQGQPCLIDPAVYVGHREVDLAMMKLFGGFSNRVFEAYQSVWPLSPGHQERVPIYQLYPLLVHVLLFGESYVSAVGRVLDTT